MAKPFVDELTAAAEAKALLEAGAAAAAAGAGTPAAGGVGTPAAGGAGTPAAGGAGTPAAPAKPKVDVKLPRFFEVKKAKKVACCVVRSTQA